MSINFNSLRIGLVVDVAVACLAALCLLTSKLSWRGFSFGRALSAASFFNVSLLLSSTARPSDSFATSVTAALALFMCTTASVSRGNLRACLHLAQAFSAAFNLLLLPLPVATASALTHLFIAWQLLDARVKALALGCLYDMLELRGFALVMLGKQRPFTLDDICSPMPEDKLPLPSNLSHENDEHGFSVAGVLISEWTTMTFILAVSTLIQLVVHARRLVFIALLDAVSRSGKDQSMLEPGALFVVWQLLALTEPIQEYFTKIKKSLSRRRQARLYGKMLSVYAASRDPPCGFWQIERSVEGLVSGISHALFIVSTSLAEALNAWVAARKIGWHALVPAAIALVHALLSRVVGRQIKRLRKRDLVGRPPNFRESFSDMLSNIRTIKSYAWEDAFRGVLWPSLDQGEYTPPMVWRALQFGLHLLGSATAEISAALAITSYINVAEAITYTDVALLTESIQSLTTCTTTVVTMGKAIEDVRKKLRFLQRFIDHESAKYIERAPTAGGTAVDLDESIFSWGDNSYSLAPITLQIKAGDFVTVVGRIGSGKTSFLSAICGEMPLTGGRGCVYGRIGYVQQKPWIMNDTFRENVLMGADFDEAYFWRVVDACALAADVRLFPNGDLTMIGTNGVNLSGGQKVRLALARALYLRADIYVLDDLLAAVDAHVERHIVERVLAADGIIGQKTRILVTHAEHLVPLSDTVIAFADGCMSVVRQTPLALNSILNKPVDYKEGVPSSDSESPKEQAVEADIYSKLPACRAVSGAWPALQRIALLSGWSAVAIVVVSQCAKSYAVHYSESLRAKLMTDSNPATVAQTLKHYLIVNALVSIGSGQLRALDDWVRDMTLSSKLAATMRRHVLDLILSMPLPLLESLPFSVMSTLFFGTRWSVSQTLPRVLCCNMLQCLLSAVSAVAQAVKSSPGLLLLCGPFVVLQCAIERWYGDTMSQLSDVRRVLLNQPAERLEMVILCNRALLRVHGLTRAYVEKLCRLNILKHQHYPLRSEAVQGSLHLVTRLSTEVIMTAMLAFKLHQQVFGSASASPGGLDAAASLALSLFYRMHRAVEQGGLSESHMDGFSRYVAYVEGAPREQPRIIEGSRPRASWPETGEIEFSRYSMRYRPELDLTLDEVSFVVRSKEKIGIVGRTGAGKSSLTYALMRLVEADSGSITVDGTDISTIGLYDLRSRISIIPQDPSLFVGTIRDNLDPSHQYTDDEVWAAINACHIGDLLDTPTGKCTEKPVATDDDDDDDQNDGPWIEGTGLDKWIKYNGSNFSVGQRQLVSLCRALLWRRKILVLDEATANVDTETDRIIQSVIRQGFKDCTVLTIAHRLNTVMDSDRILVMDKGKVAELDTPANLLARDSHFARLVESMNLSQKQV